MLKDVKKLLRARDLIIKTEGKIKKKSLPVPPVTPNSSPLESSVLDLQETQRITISEIDKSSEQYSYKAVFYNQVKVNF